MAFTPLVSCIIPVYNAEKYLDQGVRSLLDQTYPSVEIILVDDCSTDGSWEMCQRFAKDYANIRAFQNDTNAGAPLRGRERGIKESFGDWITFMDCDDYVKPEYIQHLVDTTSNGKYDIAVTGHTRYYDDDTSEDFLWDDYSQTTTERLKSFFENFFVKENFWTDPADTVGQNLIRANIAKTTDLSIYPDKVWGEDTLMALAFLANSRKGVNFIDYHDFYWRQRQGSGSHGGFSSSANRPAFYRACFDIFNKRKILPSVSVIVPMYNVEMYLRGCLHSIQEQSYPNLEIILVDDKSPDKSGLIADEFAAVDHRIKVIHKKNNGGLNSARETGFKASTAPYTIFVDSDDVISSDCVEFSLRALLKNRVDYVRFGMKKFKNDGELPRNNDSRPADYEIILEGKRDLYMTQFDPGRVLGDLPMFSMTVWGALYPKRLVDLVDWSESNFRVYEDIIWTLRFLENVSSAAYLSRVGYFYRSDDSITNVLSKQFRGNTLNGKPISYMGFWTYIWSEYYRYNKKYDINVDEIIDSVVRHLFIVRSNLLSESNAWNEEGNQVYLTKAMDVYRDQMLVSQDTITHLRSRNNALRKDREDLWVELDHRKSVGRMVRLTLGNIKRKILR